MEAALIAGASLFFTAVLAVLGYLMKSKLEKVELDLRDAQKDLVDVKVNYAHKADVHAMKQEIIARFDRLEDKLVGVK